jgi:tetratricopeptide (TPR) repeat protein
MTISQEYSTAQAVFDEALAICHRIGDAWSMSLVKFCTAHLLFAQGNLERACICLEEALPAFQQSEQLWLMTQTRYLLGKVHWRLGDKHQAITLWSESGAQARELGAKRFLAEISYMLGLAVQEENDRQQAQTLFRQSLALYQAVENKIGVAYALNGLASMTEPLAQRVQLLSCAAAVLDTARLPMDQIERAHYERTVAAVRTQLGEAAFASAWVEGQAMSLEQAVTDALATP